MKTYEQIFRYAMQMELDGYNFYMEKKSILNNPTSQRMFEALAESEMEHYKYIESLLNSYIETDTFEQGLDALPGDEKIFESREDSEHLNETLSESDIPDLTILRMAYLIERDYKEFYQNAAENIEDVEVKAIFEKLSKWEAGHEILFKSEYDKRMREYMSLPWGG